MKEGGPLFSASHCWSWWLHYFTRVNVADTAQLWAPNYFGLDSIIRTYCFPCSLLTLGLFGRCGEGSKHPAVTHFQVLSWFLDRIIRLDLMYLFHSYQKLSSNLWILKLRKTCKEKVRACRRNSCGNAVLCIQVFLCPLSYLVMTGGDSWNVAL